MIQSGDELGVGTRGSLWLGGVLAMWWTVCVVTFASVPQRHVVRVSAAGFADRSPSAHSGYWFLFPLAATLVYIVLELGMRLSVRNPELLNIPCKEIFLSLSPAQRAPILRVLHEALQRMIVAVTMGFAAMQIGLLAAQRGATSFSDMAVPVALLTVLAVMIVAARAHKRVDRLLRASCRPSSGVCL